MNQLSSDFIAEINKNISGEIKTDQVTRILYSTDASIYKINPLGVVFPRNLDELAAIVEIGNRYSIPLLPRGSGSSLAGQAIGNALIIDCSRYLNRLVNINPEERTAIVEPGLILDNLNRAVRKYNLQFGPDPASSERATVGGCIGNNAAGAHSIMHGMTADHIISANVVLADGTLTTLKAIPIKEAQRIAGDDELDFTQTPTGNIEKSLYSSALNIRDKYTEVIKTHWPITWRRVSGYNLNYLIPWSPTYPPQWNLDELPYPPVLPDTINLASLLVGSEGTLAILRSASLRLIPLPLYTILSVISFSSIVDACDIIPEILEFSPSAVELIPQSLIHLAHSVPAYAKQLSFIKNDPAAILVVEFSGDDSSKLLDQISNLHSIRKWITQPVVAETLFQQKQVWSVRKVGLGILMSRPGNLKPVAFIEDMSVPVERLGEFVREMERILNHYNSQADYYAHASAGCLHIRPLLNIKTGEGRANLRSIAVEAVALTLRLGGAISSEHGDGLARGEWIECAYGKDISHAIRLIKQSADPKGILNPGKIVDPPKMDTLLRYDNDYNPIGWKSLLSFSSRGADSEGLVEAIEQCNGAGVCRKSEGVMCPSFQATLDEEYSTRGRANLLRALVSKEFHSDEIGFQAVKDTLDKCLACKGCKAECPSAVDMAKLKYEFNFHYYTLPGHHRQMRDYLFGYIHNLGKIGHIFAPFVNPLLEKRFFAGLREHLLGISPSRSLPDLSTSSLHHQAKRVFGDVNYPDCLFLSDPFNEYFFPKTGMDALRVLKAAECRVKLLPVIGAGRTLISKGFLNNAKKHAIHLIESVEKIDPDGKLPVIGIEPSEIYTLKDEYLDLFPHEYRFEALAERAFMIDEFLIRSSQDRISRLSRITEDYGIQAPTKEVLLHGHCYQKAQPPAADGFPAGVAASVLMLEAVGYNVKTIDDGCCGMAGAFGYENEHYSLSMQIGEQALFPAVRSSGESIIATVGVSCKSQIEDGTGYPCIHPISLVARIIERQPL
jgi:FAD/FMN-containing dehydrogenase/Fe-S oxidoreductase